MAVLNGRLPATLLVRVGTDAHGRPAQLRPEAAASWQRMRAAGMPMDVTDTYRDYARQVAYRQNPPNAAGLAAVPGTSSHGWGLAVDARGACLTWLTRHGTAHGWIRTIPVAEPWHFEYQQARDRHVGRDWFTMATEAQLRAIIREEIARAQPETARSVWGYRTSHDARDAWGILRNAAADAAARVWGFKRGAGAGRKADRVDAIQMLADATTVATGKAPDVVKHPSERKSPTDF